MNVGNLGELSLLARIVLERQATAEKLTKALSAEKEHVRRLLEESIPSLMEELQISSTTIDTGEKISVGLEVYCAITEANKPAAHEWMRANGFGGLIKTAVGSSFGKDEQDLALGCFLLLDWAGFPPGMSESVHPQTLKAFLKEQLSKQLEATGEEKKSKLPLDLFSARPVFVAKIK